MRGYIAVDLFYVWTKTTLLILPVDSIVAIMHRKTAGQTDGR